MAPTLNRPPLERIFHGTDKFGTWAEPEIERYAPNAKKLDEMRKQVSLATELPGSIKKFLQLFVINRTISAHVNGDTPTAVCTDDQITLEANAWVASNPALSKQDLWCLKALLRKSGLPKLFRQNFVQDMRKEKFDGLCWAMLQHERVWQ